MDKYISAEALKRDLIDNKYSDKTEFKWVGWITRILKGGAE